MPLLTNILFVSWIYLGHWIYSSFFTTHRSFSIPFSGPSGLLGGCKLGCDCCIYPFSIKRHLGDHLGTKLSLSCSLSVKATLSLPDFQGPFLKPECWLLSFSGLLVWRTWSNWVAATPCHLVGNLLRPLGEKGHQQCRELPNLCRIFLLPFEGHVCYQGLQHTFQFLVLKF